MEGLKLQQPMLVGLGAGVAAVLGDGETGAAGGANTQRGASGAAGSRFAISRTSGSAVRLSQGARPQHEATSPGRQGSRERRSGGSGMTGRAEGVGDGTAMGDRAGPVGSIGRPGSSTPVLSGAGLGTSEGRRADAVDGVAEGDVVDRAGALAEGFGEAGLPVADLVGLGVAVGAALALGLGVALVLGLGVAVLLGLGTAVLLGLGTMLVLGLGTAVLLGLGAVLVVGLGAVVVSGWGVRVGAVREGAGRGVVPGGFGPVEAVGAALDVGVAALDDGAGVPPEVGRVSGSRPPGGFVGAALLGAAWDDLGAADDPVPRPSFPGGVVAVVRGASAFLGGVVAVVRGASVLLGGVVAVVRGASVFLGAVVAVVRGASSVGRVLPDGGAVVSALLGRAASRLSPSRRGAWDRSSGACRGAVFSVPVPVGRSGERGGEASPSGEGCARSRRALRLSVPASSGEVFLVDLAGGSASSGEVFRVDLTGGSASSGEVFPVDLAGGSASTGGFSSGRAGGSASGMSASEALPSGATSGAGGSGAYSCDGVSAFTPGSATAAHGWAMTALVVADTAASRRPESRVTRRDELRGGIGGLFLGL